MSASISDIAIIGGGVIGLALARALGKADAAVTVIDAGAAIPPATHAAAGMLAPSFEHGEGEGAIGDALYHFGARGLALWPDYAAALEEETGVFIDYRGTGALGIAYTDAEKETLAAQGARVTSLGGAAEIIDGDAARAMEPALSRHVIAALHAPKDAQVDPRLLTQALRASLDDLGARLINGKVVEVKAKEVAIESGERIATARAVIASGAVSGLYPHKLVFPVKGEAAAIECDEILTRVVRAPGAYLCPKAGGRLVIGATEIHGRDDLSVDAAGIEGLRANAAKAAPILAAARELERWAGLRPGTPDGAPIMGEDSEGRFLALGHYRNGILHAPAMAEAMAALIFGQGAPQIGPFSQERFTAKQDG